MGRLDKYNKRLKLGMFLRESRLRSGISQMEVAKKLGYSTAQFISNWERGISEPPLKALKILARLYSISPDEIFEVFLQTSLSKVTEDLKSKFEKVR